MAFQLFTSKLIANLIIKDHVIRYVGVKQTTPITVRDFRERYIPKGIIHEGKIVDHDTLLMILEECVSDWGIKKKEVRFLIPDAFVVIRRTSIPIEIKDDEILGYLYLELGGTIHLPFDEPVIDFIKIQEEENKKEVLMFAAPQDIAQDYADLLEEATLKPIAADISPLCMYRLFTFYEKTDFNEHSLLVQFDLQSVNLCIFYQHQPLFMRHLDLETTIDDWDIRQNSANTVAEIKWMNQEQTLEIIIEEIQREIEHVLNFYRFNIRNGNEQVTNILMSGDHPFFGVLTSNLIERFEIPVETIDTLNELPLHYYLPLGLALKEVQ